MPLNCNEDKKTTLTSTHAGRLYIWAAHEYPPDCFEPAAMQTVATCRSLGKLRQYRSPTPCAPKVASEACKKVSWLVATRRYRRHPRFSLRLADSCCSLRAERSLGSALFRISGCCPQLHFSAPLKVKLYANSETAKYSNRCVLVASQ